MSTITINDLTVYYEVNGNGQPLVLLPGLLGTVESDWRRFIPELSKRYCTIAVDLRGHGGTNSPSASGNPADSELSLSRMAEDLIDLLDQLGYERVSVLGYSLGGCIGLLTGLKHPGRIQALVMHATKFFWNENSIAAMTANLDPDTVLEKSPRYAQTLQRIHGSVYGNEYWKTLAKNAARFVRTMPETSPSLQQAAEAAFPILVSVGDHDQLISLEEAVKLFRTLPKGDLLVLPATRHPFHTVRIDPFVPAVTEFLERAVKS